MRPRITRLPPLAGAPSWTLAFDALTRAINTALSDIADALEGKEANATWTLVEDVFDAPAFPRYLTHGLGSKPRGLAVVRAEDLTDGTPFAVAVFPTWDVTTDGRLAVRGLTGLTTGKRYRVTYEVTA